MRTKTKIIITIIVICAITVGITLFFLSKNPLAKKIIDESRNVKAFIEVKLSKEYQAMDSEKKYVIGEKELKIPILIYHEITTKEPPRDLFYMQTTIKRFEEQIKGLSQEGYQFISYDDLIDYYNGKKAITEKTVLIGFDDGWAGNYENAYPILQKYHVPAAIYVVDDLVGTPRVFQLGSSKRNE